MNPWKDFAAYTFDDAPHFKGRDYEIAQFIHLVRKQRCSILYSESGIGKTSFIQAGIEPQLCKEGYLPVHLLFPDWVWTSADTSSPCKWILEQLRNIEGAEWFFTGSEDPENDGLDNNVWWLLHAYELKNNDGETVRPLIVFDQFEEVFTKTGNRSEILYKLFSLLEDIAGDSVPEKVSEQLQRLEKENNQYIELPEESGYKIIYSFRKEFLAEFDHWSNSEFSMPELLHSRMSLLPFSRENAEKVIIEQDDDTLLNVKDAILDSLSSGSGQGIEAILLSVVCSRLYERARSLGKSRLSVSDIQNGLVSADSIIIDFYQENISEIFEDRNDRYLFEEAIVNMEDKRRNRIRLNDSRLKKMSFARKYYKKLEDKHIIRTQTIDDDTYLELIHDRLAEAVVECHSKAKVRKTAARGVLSIIAAAAVMALLFVMLIFASTNGIGNRHLYQTSNPNRAIYAETYFCKYRTDSARVPANLLNARKLTIECPSENPSYDLSVRSVNLRNIEIVSDLKNQIDINLDLQGNTETIRFITLPPNFRQLKLTGGTFRGRKVFKTANADVSKRVEEGSAEDDNVLLFSLKPSNIIKLLRLPRDRGHVVKYVDKHSEIFFGGGYNVQDNAKELSSADTIVHCLDNYGLIHLVNLSVNNSLDRIKQLYVPRSVFSSVLGDPTFNDIENIYPESVWTTLKHEVMLRLLGYSFFLSGNNLWLFFSLVVFLFAVGVFIAEVKIRSLKKDNEQFNTILVFLESFAISVIFAPLLWVISYWSSYELFSVISDLCQSEFLDAISIWIANIFAAAFCVLSTTFIICAFNRGFWDSVKEMDLKTFFQTHIKSIIATILGLAVLIFALTVLFKGLHAKNMDYSDVVKELVPMKLEKKSCRSYIECLAPAAYSINNRYCLTLSNESVAFVPDSDNNAVSCPINGSCATYSPDGKKAITGSWNDTAIIWDVESGDTLRTLRGHRNDVNSVAFSQDGKKAITGSYDETAIIWDVESGDTLRTLRGHSRSVYSVAFSQDGKKAITGSIDNTAIIWDVESGDTLRTLRGHRNDVNSVAFSPDGKKAVTGSRDETAIIWDVESGDTLRTLRGHRNDVNSVAFSQDGKNAITGSWDKTAIIWDVESGDTLRTLRGHRNDVNSVAFSLDGEKVFTMSDVELVVWDSSSYSLVDKYYASGMLSCSLNDGEIKIIYKDGENVTSSRPLPASVFRTFHTEAIEAASFSPDGKKAVTGSRDNTAIIWDVESGDTLRTLRGHSYDVNSVAFSPDGRKAITGSGDNTAIIWDVESGDTLRTLRGHNRSVYSVAFSQDGRKAITGSYDGTAIIWDVESGDTLRTLRGHNSYVYSVAFSPNGRKAITGSYDDTAIIWDAKTGKPTAKYINVKKVFGFNKKGDSVYLSSGAGVYEMPVPRK